MPLTACTNDGLENRLIKLADIVSFGGCNYANDRDITHDTGKLQEGGNNRVKYIRNICYISVFGCCHPGEQISSRQKQNLFQEAQTGLLQAKKEDRVQKTGRVRSKALDP